jgi:D-lactate dehydrogenase
MTDEQVGVQRAASPLPGCAGRGPLVPRICPPIPGACGDALVKGRLTKHWCERSLNGEDLMVERSIDMEAGTRGMEKHTQRVHAIATTINEEDGHYLQVALGNTLALHLTPGTLRDIAPHELARTEILIPFIHPPIGQAEINAMPQLKLIATRSTGYDHIDIGYAAERRISVCNVPNYGENAVAEHTFGLILTLSRKIHLAHRRVQQGNYRLEGLRGFDLYGKTLGVIGAGAIGLHVIRIAKGFGMQVVAMDTRQNRLLAEVLGFRYVGLDELLAVSDIVSLHAPSLPSTYHIINRATLAKMKRGALLINTARGALVDTAALAHALYTGYLGGAGLDALEGEELLQREEELLQTGGTEEQQDLRMHHQQLQNLDNVVITPHIAFNSQEALQRILDTTIENIHAFLEGNPINLVSQH